MFVPCRPFADVADGNREQHLQIGNNRFKYAKKPLIYRFLSKIKGFNHFGKDSLNKNEIALRLSRWCARRDCVLASCISLAAPQGERLAHSAARPFPTRPASLGSRGGPLLAASASMPAQKTTVFRLSFLVREAGLEGGTSNYDLSNIGSPGRFSALSPADHSPACRPKIGIARVIAFALPTTQQGNKTRFYKIHLLVV